MAEVFAKAFWDLIKAAADAVRKDKRRKQQIFTMGSSFAADTGKACQIIDEIDTCLTEMIVIGRADAESQEKILGIRASHNPVLHRMLTQLRERASALLSCDLHQSKDIVSKLFVAIQEIAEADFILTTPEFMIQSSRNARLHQLLDLVEKLRTESTP